MDDPTPIYKVSFECQKNGKNRTLERYFFDNLEDALACAEELVHVNVSSTRDFELSRLNWELLKRRHRPACETANFKQDCMLGINQAFSKFHIFSKQSANGYGLPIYTWGSSESPSENLYAVQIAEHSFYQNFQPSIVPPKDVKGIHKLLENP